MNLYRPNVATLCSIGDLNRGVFLACVRKDNRAIQTVQGGIEAGETAVQALNREMVEELGIGLDGFRILQQSCKLRRYLWPPGVPAKQGFAGQEQSWFHVAIQQMDAIDLSQSCGEFESVFTVGIQELIDKTVLWKRPLLVDFCQEIGILK